MTAVLMVATLLGTGLVAGVLFCVSFSVVPAFLALEPDQYLETHRLIGRNYDRVMPATVLCTALADVLLAIGRPARGWPLFAAAAVLLLGVSAVSHLANVPINRRVKAQRGPVPVDWADPRRSWRNWNLLRTVLAFAALLAGAVAAVLS